MTALTDTARNDLIRSALGILIRNASGISSLENAVKVMRADDADHGLLRSARYEPGTTRTRPHIDTGAVDGEAPTNHPDPTGDSGAAGTDQHWARVIAEIDKRLERVLADLTWVDLQRAKAIRPPVQARPEQKPINECSHCSRWRTGATASVNGLCSQCYEAQRPKPKGHGCLPSEAIVKRWDMGKQGTPSQWVEAAATSRKRTKSAAASVLDPPCSSC